MDNTKIEWTDATWNPLRGCTRVSEGCRNCYAERVAARFSGPGMAYEGTIKDGKWNGVVKTVPEALDQPLRWKRPRRIFVNSMSDLFHETVSDQAIFAIFYVMACTPHHTYQVLTKRPARMVQWFDWVSRWDSTMQPRLAKMAGGKWPLPNVWLGVSVEDQDAADKRLPHLINTPAAVRWVSAEPLLGHVSFTGWDGKVQRNWLGEGGINWVVCGGESGHGARPMHPVWARNLRDECADAGAAFFFKQWGEYLPYGQSGAACGETHVHHQFAFYKPGKLRAGRLLDGREHNGYPQPKAVAA